ncbi:hypothetical protein, partial [Myroides sp. TSA_177.3]|uniref:hypothetical protein n=1 Tax=Myroides sp. TSA_177.3 TaxID=3415650 RepID=UPI0040456F1F
RPLLRRGDILGADYEMMIDSSLIDKSHKKQPSQPLSFLKGKKETKTPSTNPNKGQISFQG